MSFVTIYIIGQSILNIYIFLRCNHIENNLTKYSQNFMVLAEMVLNMRKGFSKNNNPTNPKNTIH